MIKLSRNGIAYDLSKTPYTHTIKYRNELEVIYSFSSRLYVENFKNRLEEHRSKINESLSNRFGLVVVNELLSDIVFYSKTEKRGFYLLVNGEEYKCLSTIKLIGENQIYKTYQE